MCFNFPSDRVGVAERAEADLDDAKFFWRPVNAAGFILLLQAKFVTLPFSCVTASI